MRRLLADMRYPTANELPNTEKTTFYVFFGKLVYKSRRTKNSSTVATKQKRNAIGKGDYTENPLWQSRMLKNKNIDTPQRD